MPAFLPLPAHAEPVLALDLGGTHLRTAVVAADGRIVARGRRRTPLREGALAVTEACIAALRETLAGHLDAGGSPPAGLGISAPGPLDSAHGILLDPPNMGETLCDYDLAPRLGVALGLPWAIERDTVVALLAEATFGAGRGFDDLVYLTISTGIGGAVLTDGRLLAGPDGVAGELGHLTVDMDGPTCGCGGRGHLERMASGTGIARSAREALEAGADAPILAALAAAVAPRPLEALDVARAAQDGDAFSAALLERARRAVAAAVVSIVDIFDPDRVILGGGISLAWGESLLRPVRELVASTAFRLQARRVQVVPAELGDDVGLIGTLPLVASALSRAATKDQPQGDRIVPATAGARHA